MGEERNGERREKESELAGVRRSLLVSSTHPSSGAARAAANCGRILVACGSHSHSTALGGDTGAHDARFT